jgi:hypothetical protein
VDAAAVPAQLRTPGLTISWRDRHRVRDLCCLDRARPVGLPAEPCRGAAVGSVCLGRRGWRSDRRLHRHRAAGRRLAFSRLPDAPVDDRTSTSAALFSWWSFVVSSWAIAAGSGSRARSPA